MTERELGALVLAAGKGTRMKSELHKVLHPIAGRPMLMHLLEAVETAGATKTVIVVGAGREQVEAAVPTHEFALQDPPQGTGHAVLCAQPAFDGFSGDILITYGDVPLVTAETLGAMRGALASSDLVVLGFRPEDPTGYGRIRQTGDGQVEAIIEHLDANEDERQIGLCNSGLMAAKAEVLFDCLDEVGNDNAKGEYYLTDVVAVARGKGYSVAAVEADPDEVSGVNSRQQLAELEQVFQRRARVSAMENGATLLDPASVHFSFDTNIGSDVVVEPNVFFGPGVSVGDGAIIHGFSHLEGATLGAGAKVGPYVRLRPGADVGIDAKIGNFVEVKKAKVATGAKVNHLSYIGDATVGAGANIGAGTITCNYDGFSKSVTTIGEGAFVGSNSTLVAPVNIGDGAFVAGGSVVTKDVSADALGITRARQEEKTGWAARFRKLKGRKT